ncbi:MAG: TetR/AcrR family transcriptional regulator, partial [Clostridiaceae bacterium]
QYLKDEVRNSIAEEALKEFLKKGYQGASIRSIAKNSNTSVGNIYKYFSSKEDIYENLIGSVYNRIIDYIGYFDRGQIKENAQDVFNGLIEKIMDIFNDSSAEIDILLNQSKGSKYENCKTIFIDFITRIVTEEMKYQLSMKGKKLKDNFIIYVISCSLVESISIIVKERTEGPEARRLVLNMIDIFYGDIINKLEYEEM